MRIKILQQMTKFYTFEIKAMGCRQNRQDRLMTPTILLKLN